MAQGRLHDGGRPVVEGASGGRPGLAERRAQIDRDRIVVWTMQVFQMITELGDLHSASPSLDRDDVLAAAGANYSSSSPATSDGQVG